MTEKKPRQIVLEGKINGWLIFVKRRKLVNWIRLTTPEILKLDCGMGDKIEIIIRKKEKVKK